MTAPGVSIQSFIAASLALAVVSGCDQLSDLVGDTVSRTEAPAPSPTKPAVEEADEELPERPATSTARSETKVITFRSIMEDREMSREERIRALQNLDPAALQKPVARSNVSAGPPAGVTQRGARQTGPDERQLFVARRRVPVVMYATNWCGVCKRARQYFKQEGISFVEHDVDEDPRAREEYLRLNPRRSVPTIKVGDEVIVGFSAQAVNRALDSAARSSLN